jgi:SAM-dependent methyltransferase
MPEATLFACPSCRANLEPAAADELRCPADGLRFQRVDGIWRLLLDKRAAFFEPFIRDYETVRRAEGRGSDDKAYYANLPYDDLSGRMPADWRIRASSFDVFLKRVLAPLERRAKALRILDLGAGNGWLSNRLALRGHAVAAVDLMTNDFDGLGCHRFYDSTFIPVQAEFDRLPFRDASGDIVIFNASLHYSADVAATLAEALRALDQAGTLVILDSPVYRNAASGALMVHERESRFTRQYGFPSNSLRSENYLTYVRLEELGSALNLEWKLITPFYGLRWAIRPVLSALSGRREPAKFHVVIARRKRTNPR